MKFQNQLHRLLAKTGCALSVDDMRRNLGFHHPVTSELNALKKAGLVEPFNLNRHPALREDKACGWNPSLGSERWPAIPAWHAWRLRRAVDWAQRYPTESAHDIAIRRERIMESYSWTRKPRWGGGSWQGQLDRLPL